MDYALHLATSYYLTDFSYPRDATKEDRKRLRIRSRGYFLKDGDLCNKHYPDQPFCFMDLDHIGVKHITAEEKQRRREKNLCLYCGSSNHFAGDCPVKKARFTAVTVASKNESA
ncbi:hypothetical protein BGZ68_006900 [Mortierella alpina]|nr:hypothetical protein BGZ68_006900 [Mortierella alpina]